MDADRCVFARDGITRRYEQTATYTRQTDTRDSAVVVDATSTWLRDDDVSQKDDQSRTTVRADTASTTMDSGLTTARHPALSVERT